MRYRQYNACCSSHGRNRLRARSADDISAFNQANGLVDAGMITLKPEIRTSFEIE